MENPYFSYTNPVKFEIRGEAQIRANMPEDFVNRWKNDKVGNLGFFPGNSIVRLNLVKSTIFQK